MKKGSILAFALLAAALSQTAGAITATKEYVDRRDTEIRTNTYTKAETDAKIVEFAPTPDMSGVVHGDDRSADKSAFEDGLKFRASDDDGGNLRLRVGDPSGVGLRWYSDSTGTSLGNPFFALTFFGITHPTAEGAEDTTLTKWDDFTRAQNVRDVMPDRNDTENRKYPISGGAFLDYFWNLRSLPTAAVDNLAGQITPNAASNLVDWAGSLVNAEDIEDRAAMLVATSTVPVHVYSDWTSDWPPDDESQPTQPVWSNGNWIVKLVMVDGSREWGPYSAAGAADALTITINVFGWDTVFERTVVSSGDLNAYGLARLSDLAPYCTLVAATNAALEAVASSYLPATWDEGNNGYLIPKLLGTGAEFTEVGVNSWNHLVEMTHTQTLPEYVTDRLAPHVQTNADQTAIISAWEGYWSGTNVIFEVTNYYGNSSGELPRLRVKEFRDGAWQTVWDEANKFSVCETNILTNVVQIIRQEGENYAPKAWGTVTDKGTPNVVSNSVWMTSPETYFAGGTEYQRVAVGSGTICVLADNGAGTYTAGEAGTFRFQDEGGTNYFGFAKSESYTIGCRTDGITVDGNLVTLRYDVIMGGTDVPIVYWRLSLSSGEWVQLNNADGTATDGAPYTVTWYTSGGSYYAAINCGSNASGFFKAETSVSGDVVFETNMKARLGGGIECQNTASGVMGVIRPTYNGSAVSWTWSAK